MIAPRWRKVLRDAWTERGRFAGMVAAVAVSLVAVGTVLGAYAVLTREMSRNYLGIHPADATFELAGSADEELARVRGVPGVERAEAGEVIRARVRVGEDWRPILLFVTDDPVEQVLMRPHPIAGPDPAPAGTAAVERTAADLFDLGVGASLELLLADGATGIVPVSAIVHDPGLAPAWQERTAYAYLSRATLAAAIGRPVALHDLRVVFADRATTADVEDRAQALAQQILADGAQIHQIRVPPLSTHPHQRQMATVITMLLAFAGLSVVLSAVLVATSLSALLARQVREIGVMKTVGATAGQIAALYAGLVGGMGALAVLVAVPVGIAASAAMSTALADMLNFDLASARSPAWVWAVQAAAGMILPLGTAAWPIARAARGTVRDALDQHGVSGGTLGPAFARLPRPMRSLLRRPGRLALSLGLLAAAGAMFVTAQSVSRSWSLNLAKIAQTRFDDVEVRFAEPVPDAVAGSLAVAGLGRVEAWDLAPAAFAVPERVDVVRTWPDRGHGSLSIVGVPPDTTLARYTVDQGRWFRADETGVAVLDQGAMAQRPGLRLGDAIDVSVDGVSTRWTVIGVIEVIGSAGAVYVPEGAFPGPAGTTSMLRIAAAEGASVDDVVRGVERALATAPVEGVLRKTELELAVGGHIQILVSLLTMMALVMATVGGLGLASTTATAVVERTREVGILKTLGATPGQVSRGFVVEALVVALASTGPAFLLAIPLTLRVDAVVGRLGFLAPLPFAFSWTAALAWVALVAGLSVVASLAPAIRAGDLTVRDALATT